ncbi:hypothetical protein GQ457_13G022380 [Hibiscus cannabinus]
MWSLNVPDNEQVLVNWVAVKVGLWCTQDEPSSSPTRKTVILMLEGTVNIAEPPCPSSIVSSQSMQFVLKKETDRGTRRMKEIEAMSHVPICKCGKETVLKTAWSDDNPGR